MFIYRCKWFIKITMYTHDKIDFLRNRSQTNIATISNYWGSHITGGHSEGPTLAGGSWAGCGSIWTKQKIVRWTSQLRLGLVIYVMFTPGVWGFDSQPVFLTDRQPMLHWWFGGPMAIEIRGWLQGTWESDGSRWARANAGVWVGQIHSKFAWQLLNR